MKATIDIPDELYRRVEAKTAIKGRAIPDLTIELFRRVLASECGDSTTSRAQSKSGPPSRACHVWIRLLS